MNTRPRGQRSAARRSMATVGVAVGVSMALAGCFASPVPSKTHSADPSSAPIASSTPSASASAPTTSSPLPVAPGSTPVTTSCSVLFTAQQVYDYNPNYGPDSTYAPASSTVAARAVAERGRACEWVNETSSVALDVAASRPAPADLATIKSAAGKGSAVTVATGVTSYYSTSGAVGQLQMFSGSYWIVISSADFTGPADVMGLAKTILGNLNLG